MTAVSVIKRGGKRPSEAYDEAKLRASIHAACIGEHVAESHATMIADTVCTSVAEWLDGKTEVTSHDIRRIALTTLTIHHPDAAYLYQHHRLIV